MTNEYPWYLLALIPLISGAIGYVTNVVAVKMMFYPVEFMGIRPFWGWQGIVPANAERLARKGLQLVTERLLKIEDLLDGVDASALLEPVEEELKARTHEMIETQAAARFAPMWGALAETAKTSIHGMAWAEVKGMSERAIGRIIRCMPQVLDLMSVILRQIRRDRSLMNRMFLEIGAEEFVFIERSGWWFGLGFGLVQLGVWVVYPAWWVLPFFGFLVGYATNWIALKLVFEPRAPKTIAGVTFQGLFHRRQKQVAAEFARISADDVFTDANLLAQLETEHAKGELMGIVAAEVDALIARYRTHPMAAGFMTPELVDAVRAEVMETVEAELYRDGGIMASIAAQSENIRTMLRERMVDLDPEAFESVLRPAFQQDEYKLIIAGALLGAGAGTLQLIYVFGRAFGG